MSSDCTACHCGHVTCPREVDGGRRVPRAAQQHRAPAGQAASESRAGGRRPCGSVARGPAEPRHADRQASSALGPGPASPGPGLPRARPCPSPPPSLWGSVQSVLVTPGGGCWACCGCSLPGSRTRVPVTPRAVPVARLARPPVVVPWDVIPRGRAEHGNPRHRLLQTCSGCEKLC